MTIAAGLNLWACSAKKLNFVVGCQAVNLIEVAMFLDDFKCLCSDRTGGTEYGYLFLHKSKMPSGRLISI